MDSETDVSEYDEGAELDFVIATLPPPTILTVNFVLEIPHASPHPNRHSRATSNILRRMVSPPHIGVVILEYLEAIVAIEVLEALVILEALEILELL